MASRARSSPPATDIAALGASAYYWAATRQPLYCLVFLLPLVITFEFAALVLRVSMLSSGDLVAVQLLRATLGLFGANAVWLPGLALVLTLTIWHVLSGRSWRIRAWVPAAMLAETLALTLPLLALSLLPLQAGGPGSPALAERLVLALGAGIYEELVFRLGLISLLMLLLADLARLPYAVAAGAATLAAAVLFAWCHYEPIGLDAFAWDTFLVRAAAGAYLSLVFIGRGLGIAVGAHAAYNLLLCVQG
ncbi:MAG: CPBP family intramembrane metalloprotease [Phycisphaerae bacterium]|nr:CPBP family intramembrane metalloprotease [Phycisphaerae bacterium]MCZ2401444.1 CPBP family intramembrane metalloprotease [Phycisphaerae bacterium]